MPPSGAHPFAFARILDIRISEMGMQLVLWDKKRGDTHEVIPLVVGAARGSLTRTPSPKGRMLTFSEWLIMYM